MDTPKMIQIMVARPSQSGKSLGILDQAEDRWYNTKHWELQGMVGQVIYAQTSESDWQGKPQYWINDYSMPAGVPGQPGQPGARAHSPGPAPAPTLPAPQRIQTAVQLPIANAAVPPPQPPPPVGFSQPLPIAKAAVDRDASIVAQTLCKAVTFPSIDIAWHGYVNLYNNYLAWREQGRSPQAEANEQAQQQGYADDIPF